MSEPNFPTSTIFCHNNLQVLRGMNSECVDLIYLDPPFNTKREFTAPIGSSAEGAGFKDVFGKEDVKDIRVEEIEYDYPQVAVFLRGIKMLGNEYNYCYLTFMAARLVECHRILKDTGSLYLHCDPTMSHYLKVLLDQIFGEKQFRNEIVWCYSGPANAKNCFPAKHDVILFFSKSRYGIFNRDEIRVPHKRQKLSAGIGMAAGSRTLQEVREKEAEQLLKGTLCRDWWGDIGSGSHMPRKERCGYPTQKPLALLERIIKASSNEGDLVLDPFCGCATACVAAEKELRKWVGIDVSQKAFDLVRMRLEREVPNDLIRAKPDFTTEPPIREPDDLIKHSKKHVYVISTPHFKDEFKVGVAENVERRLNSYQTGDPDRSYKIEYQTDPVRYYTQLESHIHRIFENRHEWVRGELPEIVKAISDFKPPPYLSEED